MTENGTRAESERPRSGAARTAPTARTSRRGKRAPADEVRVVAVEAAVAAGLAAADRPGESASARGTDLDRARRESFALPDWTDPPTGQVPRVLLDEGARRRVDPSARAELAPDIADWEADEDTLGFLVEQEEPDAADDAGGDRRAG